ncbi:MAG: DNA-binding response regulator [Actinobacteria bacterium]|nr:DNA-binding response regulator [Actinomycetota bacterium]
MEALVVYDEPEPNALLVEDDSQDRMEVKLQLEVMGLVVFDVTSAQEAREIFGIRDYSLILIHSGHAPLEALELCRQIRALSTVPILMLTQRGEVVDEELALGAGADDYVTKPIEPRILTSRVTQQIKRGESQRHPRKTLLTWENLTLDLAEHLFKIGEKEILLTNSEYRFLQLLMENPRRVFSKEQVLIAVSSLREQSKISVENYAQQLRTKIKRNGGPEVIDVVRSIGFRLASAEQSEISQDLPA